MPFIVHQAVLRILQHVHWMLHLAMVDIEVGESALKSLRQSTHKCLGLLVNDEAFTDAAGLTSAFNGHSQSLHHCDFLLTAACLCIHRCTNVSCAFASLT